MFDQAVPTVTATLQTARLRLQGERGYEAIPRRRAHPQESPLPSRWEATLHSRASDQRIDVQERSPHRSSECSSSPTIHEPQFELGLQCQDRTSTRLKSS